MSWVVLRRAAALGLVLVLLAAACTESNPTPSAANSTSGVTDRTEIASADVPAQTTTSEVVTTHQTSTPSVDPEANADLIAAAWANDIELAGRLIAAGADVNYKDNTEQSAYLIATSEGYGELLELTLLHGADVRSLDSFNGTGLIRAAERGHAHIIGRLLQTDIDVNHINNLGWTAMHEAIIFGQDDQRYGDTVRLLIARGADVELESQRDGRTPVQLAEGRRHVAITQTIQKAASSPSVDEPDRVLLNAAEQGDADLAAIALASGADLETRDAKERTALLLAATFDRLDVARLLVALDADPDALDDRHDTPYLVTGVTGSVEMFEVILAAGPDSSILNRFGGTALIPASERGHLDYVRRAVETDVDINHINDLGWTALMEAVLFGDGGDTYRQIVAALMDAGADPKITDDEGRRPAEHAERRGHAEMAGILLR